MFAEKALILNRIEGIRKDARQRGTTVVIPQDNSAIAEKSDGNEKTAIVFAKGFEPIACKDTRIRPTVITPKIELQNAKKLLRIGREIVDAEVEEVEKAPTPILTVEEMDIMIARQLALAEEMERNMEPAEKPPNNGMGLFIGIDQGEKPLLIEMKTGEQNNGPQKVWPVLKKESEKPAVGKQKDGGKVLWAGIDPKPEIKKATIPVKEEKITSLSAPKEQVQKRGHIISLFRATEGKPLTRKVKPLNGKNKDIKVETCVYAGMQDPVGIEISISDAEISEINNALTIQIGDLRITGVPPEEICEGKTLRGLFDLDVVTRQRSDEGTRAFFPRLKFVEHLNGTKPVFNATIDKVKKEKLALGSFTTTPSFHGDILHLEPKAE